MRVRLAQSLGQGCTCFWWLRSVPSDPRLICNTSARGLRKIGKNPQDGKVRVYLCNADDQSLPVNPCRCSAMHKRQGYLREHAVSGQRPRIRRVRKKPQPDWPQRSVIAVDRLGWPGPGVRTPPAGPPRGGFESDGSMQPFAARLRGTNPSQVSFDSSGGIS
jgi:hypothetical protein